MPIQRRLPKFGFNSPNRVEYKVINLSSIQALVDKYSLDTITIDTLIEKGMVSSKDLVKILGNGELTSKINVTAHAFSESAKSKIEAKEGTVTII